jgi:type II secretory pathway component GspD/PulD (secretin)
MFTRLTALSLLGLVLVVPARADETLVTRVYPVADLVVAMKDEATVTVTPAKCAMAEPPKPLVLRHRQLLKLIADSVAPGSWEGKGGRGSMDFFEMGMSLVVHQSPAIHAQLAELLDQLRRQQDVNVALELRLISVPDSFFERIGLDFTVRFKGEDGLERIGVDFNKTEKPADPRQAAILSEAQVAQLLEAIQGDQRSNVLQAPKLTISNGQSATFRLTDEQFYVTEIQAIQTGGQTVFVPKNEPRTTGHVLSVEPGVSADRRFIRMRLKLDQTVLATPAIPLFPITTFVTPVFEGGAVGQPIPMTQYLQQPRFNKLTVEKTVALPDGGSILLGGLQQVAEQRQEFGPPVLTKVPYVNRLFKNVGISKETSNLLVLVTPKVIVTEEEVQPPASRAAAEEQEACCRTKVSEPVARLLKEYEAACAAGQLAEASRLAVQALALDPACFRSKR